MKYVSTRGSSEAVGFSAAVAAGLAPDGGLYVPESIPRLDASDFEKLTLPALGTRLLAPFLQGDPLATALPTICTNAFNFPIPLTPLGDDGSFLLELFHGPTAAFKDVGARFLSGCLQATGSDSSEVATILVATSGDTGAAVASAFHRVPGVRVVILYPDGRVSPRQAHQLGCFGDNINTFAVQGSFDDCQALVKQALGDADLRARLRLTSANSISLGRLLPQMVYYAQAALQHQRATGQALNFVIPTGNLGNGMAAALARAAGLPIGRIALASNANAVLPEFFAGAPYLPRDSVATLANAMDVGTPSNFERLRWLYPDEAELRAAFDAASVSDTGIAETIRSTRRSREIVLCPHTATAMHLLDALRRDESDGVWAVVATAHPAKFDSIVEPLVGEAVDVPPELRRLLARPAFAAPLELRYSSFLAVLASAGLDSPGR